MENNIIPTVGVLIIKNKKVLLVKHGEASRHLNGKYGLPAGRTQNNESVKETARRELKEETGLDADLDNLILLPEEWQATVERKDGIKKRFSLSVFLADKFEGEINGSAETTPEWVNLEEMESCDLLPNTKEIIKKGLKFMRTQK